MGVRACAVLFVGVFRAHGGKEDGETKRMLWVSTNIL